MRFLLRRRRGNSDVQPPAEEEVQEGPPARLLQTTDDCRDVIRYNTTYNSDSVDRQLFSSLMFSVRAKSQPLDMLTMELDIRMPPLTSDFGVQVYFRRGALVDPGTLASSPLSWTPIATSDLVPRPDGSGGALIDKNAFAAAVPIPAGETMSFLVTMRGPYLDSRASPTTVSPTDATTGQMTVAYSNDWLEVSPCLGLKQTGFLGPDNLDMTSTPLLAATLYYAVGSAENSCIPAATTAPVITRMNYQFVIDMAIEELELRTDVVDAVTRVVQDQLNGPSSAVLTQYKTEFGLAQTGLYTELVSHRAYCPSSWGSCSNITTALEFTHAANLTSSDLEFELYSWPSRLVHVLNEDMQTNTLGRRLAYIGYKAFGAKVDLLVGSVPSDLLMNAAQLRFFEETVHDYLQRVVPEQSSNFPAKILGMRVDSQDFEQERRRNLQYQAFSPLDVEGTVLMKKSAIFQSDRELLAKSQQMLSPPFQAQLLSDFSMNKLLPGFEYLEPIGLDGADYFNAVSEMNALAQIAEPLYPADPAAAASATEAPALSNNNPDWVFTEPPAPTFGYDDDANVPLGEAGSDGPANGTQQQPQNGAPALSDNLLWIIIGVAVGAVVLIAAIILIYCCCCCRNKRDEDSYDDNDKPEQSRGSYARRGGGPEPSGHDLDESYGSEEYDEYQEEEYTSKSGRFRSSTTSRGRRDDEDDEDDYVDPAERALQKAKGMSVRDLKTELHAGGVDTDAYVEKDELANAYAQAVADGRVEAPASPSRGDGMDRRQRSARPMAHGAGGAKSYYGGGGGGGSRRAPPPDHHRRASTGNVRHDDHSSTSRNRHNSEPLHPSVAARRASNESSSRNNFDRRASNESRGGRRASNGSVSSRGGSGQFRSSSNPHIRRAERMSVRDLRSELRHAGISTRDMESKEDLVHAYARAAEQGRFVDNDHDDDDYHDEHHSSRRGDESSSRRDRDDSSRRGGGGGGGMPSRAQSHRPKSGGGGGGGMGHSSRALFQAKHTSVANMRAELHGAGISTREFVHKDDLFDAYAKAVDDGKVNKKRKDDMTANRRSSNGRDAPSVSTASQSQWNPQPRPAFNSGGGGTATRHNTGGGETKHAEYKANQMSVMELRWELHSLGVNTDNLSEKEDLVNAYVLAKQ